MFFERRSVVFVCLVLQPICFTDCPARRAANSSLDRPSGERPTVAGGRQRSATNDSVRYSCVHMLSAATDHLVTSVAQ